MTEKLQSLNRKRQIEQLGLVRQKDIDRHYEAGWNSALELAAYEIEHGFTKAFGKDTLSSIAIYIRGMKK